MKLRLVARPALIARTSPRLAASVVESTGINVSLSGGVYTVSLDIGSLSEHGAISIDDRDNFFIPFWDEDTDSMGRARLDEIIGVDTTLQAHDADLDAIAALSSTGFAVRIADDFWAQRAIVGTADEIAVTNGDGILGPPVISIPSTLVLTGKTVTVATQSPGDNSTKAASTAYVDTAVAAVGGGTGGLFMGTRVAKTANYTMDNADKGKTFALGGTAYFTLTFDTASGYDADFAVVVLNEDSGRAKAITITGGTNFKLYPGQSAVVYNSNDVWCVVRPQRWKLNGTLNVYVDTGGSSSNDGLATGSGGAFATIQQAFDEIANNYDLKAGNAVTINLAAGTHTTGLHASVKPVGAEGGAQIIITGASSATTTLSVTGSDCIGAFVDCTLQVRALKLQTTTSGSCITAGLGARIYVLDDIQFGACATYHVAVNGHSHVLIQNNYQIWGGASAHYAATSPGSIEVTGSITATFGAGAAFTWFALAGQLGYIGAASVTYNLNGQTVTGARYLVTNNAVINTGSGGANYFPGNSAGSSSNGLYV